MTFNDPTTRSVPTGLRKILHLNWGLMLLVGAIAATGFLMLYSAADGEHERWAQPQMIRFGVGFGMMLFIAMVPIHVWRTLAPVGYFIALCMLIAVEIIGTTGGGATRWLDLRFMQFQPSELMKICLVMVLALYYDWLQPERQSRPFWLALPLILTLVPTLLVLKQPDLGTAVLLFAGAATVVFLAGVSIWYFVAAASLGGAAISAVLYSRGTEWQILEDYQHRRIDTFLDPSLDPLKDGYHITQSKIALGSGGLTGRGFMEGTQSHLDFLPEKHTDFIFTTLAEEFGFIGSIGLLTLYALVVIFCYASAMSNKNRFGSLLTAGLGTTFFFYFALNMAMVTGLAPVVGVPLPLVSYGGSAMLVLMIAFGLIQSAHVHRPR
jgi:rod shape determining protein RodA